MIDAMVRGSAGYEAGLDALTVVAPSEADPVLTRALHDACAALWDSGWQPIELHRVVLRRGDQSGGRLVTDAVAAHLRGFAPAVVDERWQAQADALEARVWWSADAAYLDELAARWRLDRVAVLDDVVALLRVLASLPPVQVLVPPPGTAPKPAGLKPRVDARVLDRVRALLAKAESTTFPAEAETYNAKAQELAARHSIDGALLVARTGAVDVVPFAARIGVDHPYEDQKATLLDAVARANHCQTVWSPELGFSTVFGFDADLETVDVLYTSLLVQAHKAMSRAEPPGSKSGKARLRTFRLSFLAAFAVRIGERLARASESVVAEAAPADLLPVLASRDATIRETVQRVFPRTSRARGTRVDNRDGWDSGRAAADQAAVHGRDPALER